MSPETALEIAADLVARRVDVIVEVRHPGGTEEGSNVPAQPQASIRLVSGQGLPDDLGIPQDVIRDLLERKDVDLSTVASDFLLA